MKLVELLDIYKDKPASEGLFQVDSITYPFMEYYNANYQLIDYDFIVKYGSWYILDTGLTDSPFAHFKRMVQGYLATHSNSWNRIYEALNAEYNILDNYNGVSTITTSELGTEGTNHTIDGQKETNSSMSGSRSNELAITGSKKETMKELPDNNTTYSDTQTTQVSPEGGSTFTNQSKITNETEKRSASNETTFTNYKETNTESFNNYKTNVTEAYSNDYINKLEKVFNDRKTITEEVKHGNLWVTTSQSMIKSEISFRLKNNFYELIFDDFVKMYCIV